MNEALLADRVIVMNEGELILDGKPDEVFKNVEVIKNAGLDVPQQYELIDELRRLGYDIDIPESLDIKDCANAIFNYYQKKVKQ